MSGPNGLLLLFFRSADWCPFCKGQLVDLEGAQKAFASRGINVAGVSYDSQAILSDFARRRSISYPLLSDTSSSLIDAFGIRGILSHHWRSEPLRWRWGVLRTRIGTGFGDGIRNRHFSGRQRPGAV